MGNAAGGIMPGIKPHTMPGDAGIARNRIVRFLGVLGFLLGFGLALGACTKCDLPPWQPNKSGQGPLSCHDTPSTQ
jgi:hypothetical protein